MMNNEVINSPVVFNFFKRPSVSKRVFSVIREVRPKILYLISDGPRDKDEEKLVTENRMMIEGMIDWDCEVDRLYSNINFGMDKLMKLTFEKVFASYDRMIFLEEDILPSISFFQYCDELLELYKDDDSVYLIGGMNFLETYPNYSKDDPSYFFTERVSTWGMALWKRTYELIQYDLSFLDNPYYLNAVKSNFLNKKKSYYYQHMMLKKNSPEKIPFDGEYTLRGLNQNILYNSMAITPSRNLVLNIGDTEGSENADDIKMYPKSMRRNALMTLYELDFPLIHPVFKIVDFEYGRIQSTFKTKSFFKPFIKVERALRILVFGGPKKFLRKLLKFFSRKFGYERSRGQYK